MMKKIKSKSILLRRYKSIVLTVFVLLTAIPSMRAVGENDKVTSTNPPVFTNFVYQGNDIRL